jgi:predicted DNA-binding WGR domain protein
VQFGRIGTAGQTQTKTFSSADAAQKAADKLIAEKTGKGYVEVGGAAAGRRQVLDTDSRGFSQATIRFYRSSFRVDLKEW